MSLLLVYATFFGTLSLNVYPRAECLQVGRILY